MGITDHLTSKQPATEPVVTKVAWGEAAFSTGEDVVRDLKALNELKDLKVQFTEGCLVRSAQERRAVATNDCNMHEDNCSSLLPT